MAIRSQVVNLYTDRPRTGDRIGLDTNIVFWMGYSSATLSSDETSRKRRYEKYIRDAINAGAELLRSPLCLIELAYLIERTEYFVKGGDRTFGSIKAFRQNVAEQAAVSQKISDAWTDIGGITKHSDANLDSEFVAQVLANYTGAEVDAYDAAIIQSYVQSGATMIMSDDKDAMTFTAAVVVITANLNVISQVALDSSLLVRAVPEETP